MEKTSASVKKLKEDWQKIFDLNLDLPAGDLAKKLWQLAQDEGRFPGLFSFQAHYWGGQQVLEKFAGPYLREHFLMPAKAGKKIFALAMTEAHGGSDPWGMKTTLKARGEELILNGEKTLITNGLIADAFLLYARGPGENKFSVVIVPSDLPGIEKRPITLDGFASTAMAQLIFSEVILPAHCVVADPLLTSAIFQESMNGERVMMMALCGGRMEKILQETLLHCKERKLLAHDLVLKNIAEIKLAVESARLTVQAAASALDERKQAVSWATLCKLQVSVQYQQVVALAQELFASTSLYSGHFLADDRHWSLAATQFSGSTFVLKKLLAKLL